METQRLDNVEIIYEKLLPVDHERALYEGFNPGVTVLKKGYQDYEGALPFPCDTIYERDVAIKMRDGTTVYADIYRPVTDEKLPALYSCSWAGKSARHDMWAHVFPEGKYLMSGRQLWLGLDPAQWVQHGYAVVSVDSRGVYASEGNVRFPCKQEGQDGYDVIEWLAKQDWCDGKVAAVGQRWTGEMHWFTSAECPPHLVCVAPWDAHGSLYREEFVRGGIPKARGTTLDRSFGYNYIEAIDDMIEKYPFVNNNYWEDRMVDFSKIKIPAFLLGSYNSQYHSRGNVNAFHQIKSEKKWLRMMDFLGFEYPYNQEYLGELRAFLDHFVKGADNGWEDMPKVRMTVLNPGGEDIVDRPETDFPPERMAPQKVYLNAETSKFENAPLADESKLAYTADDGKDRAELVYTFDEETELTGPMKLKLWVEADGSDDMDLFLTIEKLDADGTPLPHKCYNSVAGKLRVSHRALDPEKSTELEPYHKHTGEDLLSPGEIVPIEIDIWPTSILFGAGQSLRINIAGWGDTGMPMIFEPGWVEPKLRNKGRHIFHAGGKYDSHLLMPVCPKK